MMMTFRLGFLGGIVGQQRPLIGLRDWYKQGASDDIQFHVALVVRICILLQARVDV